MTDQPEEPKKYGRGEHPNAKATQFGGEKAAPHYSEIPGATKPWSYRNVARYLSAQRVDIDDNNAIKKLLSKTPTMAEKMIAAAFTKASKGDMRAIEWLGNQVDGKVAETRINAEFADLEGKSDDELLRIANGFNIANEASGSPPDTGEAAGSTQPADDAGEPAGETADPSGV